MKTFACALAACLIFASTHGQSHLPFVGTKAFGKGRMTSTTTDLWSVIHNPAGLHETKTITLASAHHRGYHASMSESGAVAGVPLPFGVLGVGLYRFGDKLYSEDILHVAHASSFGIAALGVRASLVQYSAKDFERVRAVTFSIGGIASLTSRLTIGAYITNINQPTIKENGETVQASLHTGIRYKTSEKLFLHAEVEKEQRKTPVVKSGMEYNFNTKFSFRSGLTLNPDAVHMGFGFHKGQYDIQYGGALHLILGYTQQLGLMYSFRQ